MLAVMYGCGRPSAQLQTQAQMCLWRLWPVRLCQWPVRIFVTVFEYVHALYNVVVRVGPIEQNVYAFRASDRSI